MATAQINARIDADVKQLGDRALGEIGYTPTQAIRALWEFAGKNVRNRKALRDVMAVFEGQQEQTSRGAEIAARVKKLDEGPLIIERALREMGIENPQPLAVCDEELLEEALFDKMRERGLMYD